jgi:hypothetical protein
MLFHRTDISWEEFETTYRWRLNYCPNIYFNFEFKVISPIVSFTAILKIKLLSSTP